MRIAQVAPPLESVPPARYGGTERIVATLTNELVRRGHDVTLFASGDSHTRARLVPVLEEAAWHHRPPYRDMAPFWSLTLGRLLRDMSHFDIVHSHLDHFGLAAARAGGPPVITTLHGRLDLPALPPLEGPAVELSGQVGGKQKDDFLGNAAALLFPISWPEPFGLVMPEALACGTPVLALRAGSVPEIITDGVTGFIRDTEDELVEAVARIREIDRARCRAEVERRYTARVMTDNYLNVYERLSAQQVAKEPASIA